MSSLVRRIQRQHRKDQRICRRVKNLTPRQAQRGIKKGVSE